MAYLNVSMDTVMIRLINYLNGFLVSKETVELRLWESDLFYMHLHECHLLHNVHAMQENVHRRNREKTGGPLSRTPTRRRKKKTTQTHPNQSRAILIFLITPTTT